MKERTSLYIPSQIEVNPTEPRRIDPRQLGLPLEHRGYINWKQIEAEPLDVRCLMMEEAGRRILESEVRLTTTELKNKGLSGFSDGVQKRYPGGIHELRRRLKIESPEKPKGYWSTENIEKEARSFVTQYGDLNSDLLLANSHGNLALAISRHYPNGLSGLRISLGLNRGKAHHEFWTIPQIEKEATEFLESYGNINITLLRENGRCDLSNAIQKKYPDGISGIRTQLRLEGPPRRHGYWTPDKVEQKANEFASRFGNISYSLLKKEAPYLYVAIQKYNPGIIVKLQQSLQVTQKRKPKHYWRNPAVIENEARKFLETGLPLNQTIMINSGFAGLTTAISKHYPGGLVALRRNLGIQESDKTSPLSSTEANKWLGELVGEE